MTKKRLTTDADLFRMLIDEVKTQEPIALELLHTYKEFLLLKGVIEIDGRGNMWRLEYTEDWDGTND